MSKVGVLALLLLFVGTASAYSTKQYVCPESSYERVRVQFANALSGCNNMVARDAVHDAPVVRWKEAVANKLYMLVIADGSNPIPDNAYEAERLHFLATDVPGTDLIRGIDVDEVKNPRASWLIPDPEKGVHTYGVFVFDQTSPTDDVIHIQRGAKDFMPKQWKQRIAKRKSFDKNSLAKHFYFSEQPVATSIFRVTSSNVA